MPFRNRTRRIGGRYSRAGRFVVRRKQLQPIPKGRKGVVKAWSMVKSDPRGAQKSIYQAVMNELTNPKSATANLVRAHVNKQRQPKGKPIKMGPHRHETIKSESAGPINKGHGYNKSRFGKCYTHPKSKIPAWKSKRLREYKNDVWQTVLLSRTLKTEANGSVSKVSRVANSDNILKMVRYPMKMPEALDGERVQTMVFSPYPSAYSGIHTTFYRKIRTDGTDLDHATNSPLDVIQNKADVSRHQLPSSVEAAGGSTIAYETEGTSAADTQSVANLANVNKFYDHLLKGIHIDLTFMSSRAFDVRVSVSVVRHLKPVAPYTWTTEDKQQLFNSLSYRGMEWTDYRVEYETEFILPALKKDRKPPVKHIKKTLHTNIMVTNSFNNDNIADSYSQSSLNQLGLGFRRRQNEVADGNVSGMTYVIIKFRRSNHQPQQFTYVQNLQSNSNGANLASLELPAISEENFDIPTVTGQSAIQVSETPFETSQGNEARASGYCFGKIRYRFGYREDVEGVPSVMSMTPSANDYKKTQALNIDPTLTNDTTNGIYTQSQLHQTKATHNT